MKTKMILFATILILNIKLQTLNCFAQTDGSTCSKAQPLAIPTPNSEFAMSDDELWFEFTATDSPITITTAIGNAPVANIRKLTLYNDNCSTPTMLNESQVISFPSMTVSGLTAGQKYKLKVEKDASRATGNFMMSLVDAGPGPAPGPVTCYERPQWIAEGGNGGNPVKAPGSVPVPQPTNAIMYLKPNCTKLGIGTSDPQATFHLMGTQWVTGGSIWIQDGTLKVGNSITVGSQTIPGADQISANSGQIDFLNTKLLNIGQIEVDKENVAGDGIKIRGTNDTRITIGTGQPTAWSWANGWDTPGDFSLIEEGISGSRIYVRPGGNVGIGTTIPDCKLHIKGDHNAVCIETDAMSVFPYSDIAFKEGGLGTGDGNRNWTIRAHTSASSTPKALEIGSYNANSKLYMIGLNITDINVGIGTRNLSSDYMLSVGGAIKAKRVVIEVGWSDFVFEKKYKLMPLYELEQFINKNKHLPEIPSAKEVEANGISVGEIQSKLLQKVEELTLYMIELKKENDELNKKIEAMQKLDK